MQSKILNLGGIMPEFRLRYKLPANLTTDLEVNEFLERVTQMAEEIQLVAERVFCLRVVWEIVEFGRSRGMSDFDVTGWVNDNDGSVNHIIFEAQSKILDRMRTLTTRDETVSCWIQGVRGKLGESSGFMR